MVGPVDVTTYGDDPPASGLGRWDLDGRVLSTVRLPGASASNATQGSTTPYAPGPLLGGVRLTRTP